MGHTNKTECSKEQTERAENLWIGFTKLLKYGTIATIACVILLALITL